MMVLAGPVVTVLGGAGVTVLTALAPVLVLTQGTDKLLSLFDLRGQERSDATGKE